jgi:phosphate transport system permease protein
MSASEPRTRFAVPQADIDVLDDRPRRRRSFRPDDVVQAAVAAVAAGALAGTLRVFLGWHGILSTALWWYVGFLAFFYLLERDRSSDDTATDRMMTVLIWSAAIVVVAVLGWMLIFLLAKGWAALRPSFFTQDLSKVGPLNPGGGAKHAIIGTLEQVAIATVVVVPLAVLTAVYLHELNGRMAPLIRLIVDAMSGLPSIVAGLLIYTVWVIHHGYSGIAGSAAIAVLMLPIVTRASEEILRTIPDPLREASMALGAPQWRVVLRVVIPTARAGLLTAAILGVARGVGETAPMLLTAFGNNGTNNNPLHGAQADLPLFVWGLIREPNKTQNDRAWTGLLILVLLVLVLFVLARFIANRSQRKLGRSR